jgi:hypothetical protein
MIKQPAPSRAFFTNASAGTLPNDCLPTEPRDEPTAVIAKGNCPLYGSIASMRRMGIVAAKGKGT